MDAKRPSRIPSGEGGDARHLKFKRRINSMEKQTRETTAAEATTPSLTLWQILVKVIVGHQTSPGFLLISFKSTPLHRLYCVLLVFEKKNFFIREPPNCWKKKINFSPR